MTIMYLHARKEKKGKNKEKEEALVGNKVEVREGCCEWWWLMYVRAIYIPLCKKISSSSSQTLPFCLFPPIHPFSTLLKFLPSFPSVEAASRASRASLPSCLQCEHPSTRRFGKLPLFLSRSNISAASKRRARHHAFPVKRLPLDFLSTRRTGIAKDLLQRSSRSGSSFGCFFSKEKWEKGSFLLQARGWREDRRDWTRTMEKWKWKRRQKDSFGGGYGLIRMARWFRGDTWLLVVMGSTFCSILREPLLRPWDMCVDMTRVGQLFGK